MGLAAASFALGDANTRPRGGLNAIKRPGCTCAARAHIPQPRPPSAIAREEPCMALELVLPTGLMLVRGHVQLGIGIDLGANKFEKEDKNRQAF